MQLLVNRTVQLSVLQSDTLQRELQLQHAIVACLPADFVSQLYAQINHGEAYLYPKGRLECFQVHFDYVAMLKIEP